MGTSTSWRALSYLIMNRQVTRKLLPNDRLLKAFLFNYGFVYGRVMAGCFLPMIKRSSPATPSLSHRMWVPHISTSRSWTSTNSEHSVWSNWRYAAYHRWNQFTVRLHYTPLCSGALNVSVGRNYLSISYFGSERLTRACFLRLLQNEDGTTPAWSDR